MFETTIPIPTLKDASMTAVIMRFITAKSTSHNKKTKF